MKKKVILFITLLLLTISLVYSQTIPQGFEYRAGARNITITKYTGNASILVIPSEIEGLPVTAIGDSAFQDCTRLTNITIPNSVTSIGFGAVIARCV